VPEMEELGRVVWWPSAAVLQGRAANRPELLRSRAVVVSVVGKVGKRRTTGMKKEMQILYIEVLATHDGPEPCVGCSQGRRRSVGRGRAGRLLSRESPSSGCRRLRLERKATPRATLSSSRRGTPRGRRTQACTKLFMLRTGRSCGRPCLLMMPRPGWIAGWQIDVLTGREGNAEAVIPR
jgi:hypothetical protein